MLRPKPRSRNSQTCRSKAGKIGICGQSPSDYPEFAQFLVEQGIDSISLNPNTVLMQSDEAVVDSTFGAYGRDSVGIPSASSAEGG